jgi:hypothetical protein
MDEKDDIIEKQIADAMIGTTGSLVDNINNGVKNLEERATVTELKLDILESDIEELRDSIKKIDDNINTKASRQDLENLRKEIEDEFKGMLTKSMYIVFALVFIAILFGYFF